MKIKALLFDFDGTLVDSESFHCQCWNEILKEFKVSIEVTEYLKDHAGKPSPLNAEIFIQKFKLPVSSAYLISKKERVTNSLLENFEIRMMDYAHEVIHYLSNKGIPLALVTGSTKSNVLITLKRLGLLELFKVIITRNDVTTSKPSPECYNLCLERLGVGKSEAIAFEDTRNGLLSAKSAGIFCCIVKSEIENDNEFLEADLIFKNLKEAKDWIEGEEIYRNYNE